MEQVWDGRDAVDSPPKRRVGRAATIKVRNIAAIPKVLRELGVDSNALMREAGVSPTLFARPDSVMPFAAAARLIARCVVASDCDVFGLQVGALSGPPSIGLPGLVSVNSRTVREGIGIIVGTLTTVGAGGEAFLDIREGMASLGYSVTTPDIEAIDHIEDIALAIGANVMRRLCGPGWRPTRVRLARNPPRDRSLHARFYRSPIDFAAPRACLDFDATVLDAAAAAYDPELADILTPLLEEALAKIRPDLVFSVRSAIRTQLVSGALSRSDVCDTLRLNPQTLAHRLAPYGVTYTSLVEEARYEAARGLLLKDRSLSEIATKLGFSEQSAFTRAFKAWSGTTPARWRATQGRS